MLTLPASESPVAVLQSGDHVKIQKPIRISLGKSVRCETFVCLKGVPRKTEHTNGSGLYATDRDRHATVTE